MNDHLMVQNDYVRTTYYNSKINMLTFTLLDKNRIIAKVKQAQY